MVKKLKAMAEKQAAGPTSLLDSQLAKTVKDSAQQIWLAGMGAFSEAQGKGAKAFESLMQQGLNLQKKTQGAAEATMGAAATKMSSMAGEVGAKANASWDRLESIFEARTAKAMSRLGVPTAKDLTALTARLDALSAAVAALGGKVPAKAAKPAAKGAGAPATKAAKARKPAATPAAPAVVAAKATRKRAAAGAATT